MTLLKKSKGRFIWRKQSHDTKVKDISLSINGFIVFSFLADPKDTFIIIMNRAIYARFDD